MIDILLILAWSAILTAVLTVLVWVLWVMIVLPFAKIWEILNK